MPIPSLNQASSISSQRAPGASLRLVPVSRPGIASKARRLAAHSLDLVFLYGLSLAFSQVLAIVFLQMHLPAVNEFGQQGLKVAQSGYEYGQSWLFWGTFFFLNFVYFVAIPLITSTTLGLGLLGCKLIKSEEGSVSWDALLIRWFGLGIQYVTLGVPVFMSRSGPLVQDKLSKTHIVLSD